MVPFQLAFTLIVRNHHNSESLKTQNQNCSRARVEKLEHKQDDDGGRQIMD